MTRILLVEDDESLGSTLVERLTVEGYEVQWAQTCLEGRGAFKGGRFDLVILDVGLPDGSGFTLGREIKEASLTPLIFLTAMNSAEYRLEGFELGADDYIPKPFHLKELLLRVRKFIEGRKSEATRTLGDLTLDFEGLCLRFSDGHVENLAARDFELLKFLTEESPRVVGRLEILTKVFRANEDTTQRIVDNSILRIRASLGPEHERKLRSVRGVGYQWM